MGIVQLQRVGATVHSGGWSSHCSGFSCGTCALGARTSVVAALGLSSGGAQVQLLCGMWNVPGPGIKPMSPALAGGFLSTIPSRNSFFKNLFIWLHQVLVAAHGIVNLHFSLWGYL